MEKLEQIHRILSLLTIEITHIKEEQCQNSGFNWKDGIQPFLDELKEKEEIIHKNCGKRVEDCDCEEVDIKVVD